jgi:hypothetical protein
LKPCKASSLHGPDNRCVYCTHTWHPFKEGTARYTREGCNAQGWVTMPKGPAFCLQQCWLLSQRHPHTTSAGRPQHKRPGILHAVYTQYSLGAAPASKQHMYSNTHTPTTHVLHIQYKNTDVALMPSLYLLCC